MAEEDRISSLPDHLLLEIISRINIMGKGRKQEERLMSTKEVIKTTTTISKRWRHLWTQLPTLVFIDEDFKINSVYNYNDFTKYILFIDKALTQCPTDVNLKKFKLQICDVDHLTLQVNRWIRYAIARNVQEIDLRITDMSRNQSCDDQLFFNNSCLISMEVSRCIFNPPKGTIRWDKLKFLRIDEGKLDEDIIGKILSGSPRLETLEFNDCFLVERIPKSLFGNFGVLERLSCNLEAYEGFSYDDELFLDNSYPFMSMKLLGCMFNPPTGAIHCDKLKFLCIHLGELDEDLIGYILSESPFLETLQLNCCCGFSRIDVTSKSVKNLVLSGYSRPWAGYDIDTLEINAPYISSLTIEGKMYLEEFLLENVSSLVKADLNYWVEEKFVDELGRDLDVVEEELLRGLLSSLGHVNEIVLGTLHSCTLALSRLEASGFQFRKGSDLREIFERFSSHDELLLHNSCPIMSMKLSRCVFNPPTGAIRCDKLKFLCIDGGELDEDSIGNILSGSPFLETLQLNDCCGFRRIDVTSKSVKNLVLSGYDYRCPEGNYCIDTLEINAPYILSLTIKEKMCLEELLLQNVSSLVKADLNYWVSYLFAEELGRDQEVLEENFIRGLLSSLGHVHEIVLGTLHNCTWALSRLEATYTFPVS